MYGIIFCRSGVEHTPAALQAAAASQHASGSPPASAFRNMPQVVIELQWQFISAGSLHSIYDYSLSAALYWITILWNWSDRFSCFLNHLYSDFLAHKGIRETGQGFLLSVHTYWSIVWHSHTWWIVARSGAEVLTECQAQAQESWQQMRSLHSGLHAS